MIVVIFYFISVFILLLYAAFLILPAIYFHFCKKNVSAKKSELKLISIILPVRNEEKNIVLCLESLKKLDYPESLFEIILINDHSKDQTKNIAERFLKTISNLRIIDNPNNSQGKKSAITNGINHSKGEIIVTTDGDCIVPVSWLKNISAIFSDEMVEFAAGPVAYKKSNDMFRDFLEIEQISLQIISGGSMMIGIPLLCSGANLAYTKKFFSDCGGYNNDKFASGDDMFLMKKAAKLQKGKIRFIPKKSSIVLTNSALGWSEAISQRGRWLSKFSAYRNSATGIIGILVFLAGLLPIILTVFSIVYPILLPVLISALIWKTLIDLLLLSLAVPFFREPRLLLLAPVAEIFYSFLAVFSTIAGLSGTYSWKGRKWNR